MAYNDESDLLDVVSSPSRPSQQLNALTYGESKVLNLINETIADIDAALSAQPHGEVNIVLKRAIKTKNRQGGVRNLKPERCQNSGDTKAKASYRQVKYSWPGSTPEEAWWFSTTPSPALRESSFPTSFVKQYTAAFYTNPLTLMFSMCPCYPSRGQHSDPQQCHRDETVCLHTPITLAMMSLTDH